MERINIWFNNLNIVGVNWTLVAIFGLIGIFVLLYFTFSNLYQYFADSKVIRNALNEMYRKMGVQEKLRIAENRKNKLIYGKIDKIDWQTKLDLKIKHTGLRDKINWLSVEMFIAINVVLMILAFILGNILFENPFYSLIMVVATPIIINLIMSILTIKRYNQTEDCVISFANIIENFATGSSDLIEVFEKVAPYMDKVLRVPLEKCVRTARTTGDVGLAIDELQENVEYEQFQTLVKNLEICSRYESNYTEIIHECREMLQIHLRDQRERKQIYRDGRIMILTLLGCGFLCVSMIGETVDMEGGILEFLLSSPSGILVLVMLIGILITCLYLAFIKGNK